MACHVETVQWHVRSGSINKEMQESFAHDSRANIAYTTLGELRTMIQTLKNKTYNHADDIPAGVSERPALWCNSEPFCGDAYSISARE